MEDTLKVLNEFEAMGLFNKYAICGAMAAILYVEAFATEDLDILILVPSTVPKLAPLGAIYQEAEKRGFPLDGPWIIIAGIAVQFLDVYSALVGEALAEAKEIVYLGVPTRVLSAEHLCAIMVSTGRAKDRGRLETMLASGKVDTDKLNEILERHGLVEKFKVWVS